MSSETQPEHLPSRAAALFQNPGKVSIYSTTGGLVLGAFAGHNLTLIPPIPANAVIHDNACGPGTVTKHIIALPNTPSNPTFHATDIDQLFLDAFSTEVQTNKWPVEISNQKSEALSFADNFFDLSITNMGIIFTSSAGLDGAKEIYRTLKPGGTAVMNCWEHITWLPPFIRAHKITRPGVEWRAPPVSWSDGTHLKEIMLEAGFKEEDVRMERSEAWAKTRDLRRWAEGFWAFLGGMGGWHESDEERWDEALDVLVQEMMGAEGTKVVDGEVWMRASQWICVARK